MILLASNLDSRMAAKKAKDWHGVVKGLLRAELARRNLSYRDLAERLNATEASIKNKIGRGTFSAAFFVQCLDAIGCKTLHLSDD